MLGSALRFSEATPPEIHCLLFSMSLADSGQSRSGFSTWICTRVDSSRREATLPYCCCQLYFAIFVVIIPGFRAKIFAHAPSNRHLRRGALPARREPIQRRHNHMFFVDIICISSAA